MAPTRLYYHVNQLEELGLIRVAETRIVGGIIEKHYRAAATRLSVDRGLLAPGSVPADPALETMLSAILDGVRDAVRDSIRAKLVDPAHEAPAEHGLLLGRKWLRLTPNDAAEFYDRLVALLAEFESRAGETSAAGSLPYEVLLGLYPVTESRPSTAEENDHD